MVPYKVPLKLCKPTKIIYGQRPCLTKYLLPLLKNFELVNRKRWENGIKAKQNPWGCINLWKVFGKCNLNKHGHKLLWHVIRPMCYTLRKYSQKAIRMKYDVAYNQTVCRPWGYYSRYGRSLSCMFHIIIRLVMFWPGRRKKKKHVILSIFDKQNSVIDGWYYPQRDII